MRDLWSEARKFEIWLQIELLASEALVKEGIVPKADFTRLKRGIDLCLADVPALTRRAKELEKTLNHDVIGFTTAVSEKINHPASRWDGAARKPSDTAWAAGAAASNTKISTLRAE